MLSTAQSSSDIPNPQILFLFSPLPMEHHLVLFLCRQTKVGSSCESTRLRRELAQTRARTALLAFKGLSQSSVNFSPALPSSRGARPNTVTAPVLRDKVRGP